MVCNWRPRWDSQSVPPSFSRSMSLGTDYKWCKQFKFRLLDWTLHALAVYNSFGTQDSTLWQRGQFSELRTRGPGIVYYYGNRLITLLEMYVVLTDDNPPPFGNLSSPNPCYILVPHTCVAAVKSLMIKHSIKKLSNTASEAAIHAVYG